MMMIMGLRPTHPGEILREDILPALGKGKAEIARALGVSRHALYAVLAERARIIPELALRIGKLCGNGAEIWGRLQLAYDLAMQGEALADEIDRIPTLEAA